MLSRYSTTAPKLEALHLPLAAGVLFTLACVMCQADQSLRATVPVFSWNNWSNGRFATCVCSDSAGYWVGTEDKGVWHFNTSTGKWTQACAPNTLNDVSIYSMAMDLDGRLWVGTLNHGLAVYDGHAWWSYYGIRQGLTGVHVFAIAVDPLDGSVFVATEAGLTRYNEATSTWAFTPLNVNGQLVEPWPIKS